MAVRAADGAGRCGGDGMSDIDLTGVPRNSTVRAIQWTGPEACTEVFAFLGWPHDEDEQNHALITLPSGVEVQWGDWIVMQGQDDFAAYTAAEFVALFEPAEPTDAEVEAGARALADNVAAALGDWATAWDGMSESERDEARDSVRAALTAAARVRTGGDR